MREIKFRVWDIVRKQMYTVDYLTGNMDNELYFKLYPDDKCKCILMQFTGLYDDNNQEIYEGDILATDWVHYDEGKRIGTIRVYFTVMWYSAMAKFVFCYSDAMLPMHKLYIESSEIGDLNRFTVKDFEVVGNIYENSELLKENRNELEENDCAEQTSN